MTDFIVFQMFNNRSQFLKIWWLKFDIDNQSFYDAFEKGRLGFYDDIADQIVEETKDS